MDPVEDGADDAQPTETTALLLSRSNSQPFPGQSPLPLIEPVILRVMSKGIASCTDADLRPIQPTSRAEETAFSLIVLLYARHSTWLRQRYSGDIVERWQAQEQQVQEQHLLEHKLLSLWTTFLAQCPSDEEIEVVLWMSFTYNKPGHQSKRVVDFLCGLPSLEELLTHPVVLLSVTRTWKLGRIRNGSEMPYLSRLLHRFDALGTPRVMHAIDLAMLLAYMATLAHLLISPPTHSVDQTAIVSPGLHEAALMVYSITRLYKRPAFSEIPHILVLGAFTSHLPEVIYPDDVAFGVLLFAFSWMVIDLHLPWSTSPLHLIPAELILPRSVLISHGVSRIFIPVVAFFLPALLLSLFLLSTSLADIIPAVVPASLTPAPLESRVAFLMLFAVLFLTMICSLTMLVTVYPSFVSQNPTDPWDRCSRPIGLEARRFFIRTVVRYSVPYTFPAPFNLLQLVIRSPEMLLSLIRDRGSSPAIPALRLPERIVWRMTVGPVVVVFGVFWLWGLRSW